MGLRLRDVWKPVVYGLLNIVTASGIVFANKAVMTTFGFKFIYALTLIHPITTLFGMKAFAAFGMFEAKTLPKLSIAPLAGAYVGYIVLNNLNLQMNTVGFYQISKIAVAPAVRGWRACARVLLSARKPALAGLACSVRPGGQRHPPPRATDSLRRLPGYSVLGEWHALPRLPRGQQVRTRPPGSRRAPAHAPPPARRCCSQRRSSSASGRPSAWWPPSSWSASASASPPSRTRRLGLAAGSALPLLPGCDRAWCTALPVLEARSSAPVATRRQDLGGPGRSPVCVLPGRRPVGVLGGSSAPARGASAGARARAGVR